MLKYFFILLTTCLFFYYVWRIIKKKSNPTLNGALAVMFGFATWIEILPFLSKLIKSLLIN